MPKRAKTKTAIEVRRLTAPGIYAIGEVAGLQLRVKHAAARSWILRVMVGKRRKDIGLGAYPTVPLEEARDKARAMRRLIDEGQDPVEVRRRIRAAILKAHMKRLTFHDAVKAVLAFKTREFSNAKHAKQWERTLVTYAGPTLDAVPVGEIETTHIVKTLEPIWMMKTETASRVRQRIETVLDWCVAAGHMPGPNPARWKGHLDKLLPKATKIKAVKHHRAISYREVGGLIVKLCERRGLAARALEFAILTAARSGEVRGARWDEIDREARIWTVPARRMKTKVEQRVPLSTEALRLLDQAPRFEGTDLVFPASRGDVLSDMTLVTVLRRMAVDAVPHGFRATFKTWATEQTAYPREVIEAALAHTMGDKTEQAYQRGDLLEKRRAPLWSS